MPALAPVPPTILKKILELAGYKTFKEDVHNWAMARKDDELPIILPKLGRYVAVEVMMNALDRAKMDNATYFALHEKAVN